MAFIVSSDEIKKELTNYSPDKAEEFHRESAMKTDKIFSKALKERSYIGVILLNGGTASGKSEFLSTQLKGKNYIILDATLSTELDAKNKLRQNMKVGKTPIIYSVIPDDLKRAFIAFLSRDRKFSDTHFYKTHSGSRRTLLWITKNYPDIEINIVESSYTLDGKLQSSQIQFDQKKKLYNTQKQMLPPELQFLSIALTVA